MKVKLSNKFLDANKDYSGWLKKDKVYSVLSIEVLDNGPIKYRIESDDASTPVLFSMDMFEIVSTKIPSTWSMKHVNDIGIDFQPEKWSKDDFWEDFFNNDKDAIQIYEEEREKIFKDS